MPPVPDRQPAKQMVQSTVQWGGRTHKAGGRDLDGRTLGPDTQHWPTRGSR